MEFGTYYLVRPSEIKTIAKLASVKKLGKLVDAKTKERWIPIPVEDNLPKLVDIALHFDNYEWSAWDFDRRERRVRNRRVDERHRRQRQDRQGRGGARRRSEDMEKLAKLVGFDVIPITPTDFEGGGDHDE